MFSLEPCLYWNSVWCYWEAEDTSRYNLLHTCCNLTHCIVVNSISLSSAVLNRGQIKCKSDITKELINPYSAKKKNASENVVC